VQGDVSQSADVARIFAETKQAYGKLDILVNNAGVYKMEPLEAITPDEFHRQFNTNVLGLITATQEAAKLFGENGGSVINISSTITSLMPPNSAVYTATKAAVDSITVVLSKELGPKKIRVNAINPGMVVTEGVHAAGFVDSEFSKYAVSITPLGRLGQPDDIAPVAVFLASDDSHWITGETLLVAGGMR